MLLNRSGTITSSSQSSSKLLNDCGVTSSFSKFLNIIELPRGVPRVPRNILDNNILLKMHQHIMLLWTLACSAVVVLADVDYVAPAVSPNIKNTRIIARSHYSQIPPRKVLYPGVKPTQNGPSWAIMGYLLTIMFGFLIIVCKMFAPVQVPLSALPLQPLSVCLYVILYCYTYKYIYIYIYHII